MASATVAGTRLSIGSPAFTRDRISEDETANGKPRSIRPRNGGGKTGGVPPVFPPPFRGRMLRGFPFAVSSSEIRSRVKAGLPIDNLVPATVAEAIRTRQLYA